MKQATIVIRDEVNIKLEGLDLDVRRALVTAFKYDVPYARYLPAVRLGRWDGKVSYFNWAGQHSPTCCLKSCPCWSNTTGMWNWMTNATTQ